MMDYSVFLDKSVRLERVAAALGDQLSIEPDDISPDRLEGRGYEWISMGVRYYLKDRPGFEDDSGIPLSSYGIQIRIDPSPEARVFDEREMMLEAIARYVAWLLSNTLGVRTTVVGDLQRILAQYGK